MYVNYIHVYMYVNYTSILQKNHGNNRLFFIKKSIHINKKQ